MLSRLLANLLIVFKYLALNHSVSAALPLYQYLKQLYKFPMTVLRNCEHLGKKRERTVCHFIGDGMKNRDV